MITVAILDDGICSSRIPLLGKLYRSIAVAEDGTISLAGEPDKMTHGTLCAAIVRSYAPDAELISVKVLNHITRKGSISQIRYALEWCIAQKVSLINLSVGSTSFKDWKLLQPVMACLVREKIPLICACSNNEIPSIFSNFSWPISVEKDDILLENQYDSKNGNFFESDFCASSTHTLVTSENRTITFSSQNSHAAPVVTAKASQLLKEHGKLPIEKLRRLLRKNSLDSNFHIKPIPDFIDKAIIIGHPQYPEDLWLFSRDMEERTGKPVFLAIFPEASPDVKLLKKIIYRYSSDLLGVLYAGAAPNAIKEIANQIGCLFWDESEYTKEASKIFLPSVNMEAIRLLFRGSHIAAVRLAQLLQRTMIDRKYRCAAFSDWPQAYSLGMLFLSYPINTVAYIGSFINHFQLDAVLVCSSSIDMEYDMIISCYENSVILEYDDQQRTYSTETFPADQITEYILELLS